jgi:predicted membrane channel-forming protein YqfA (hemolysin III family)
MERKMKNIIKLILNVGELIIAVLAIIQKNNFTLIYILWGLFLFDIILQLTADESKGEAKLNPSGFFTYLVVGVIGMFIFKPWWRGFVILNVLFDGLLSIKGMFKILLNRNRF